jgi:hypothetical protein
MKKYIYTDIDYVLSLSTEVKKYSTTWGFLQKFNAKAVSIYNEILAKTGAVPVISSDWKDHWTLQQLQEIFVEWAGISIPPIDVTESIPGITMELLEKWRAKEILQHVEKHKPDAWIAIDDLYLIPHITEEHFVYCSHVTEGIKQSGKKDQAIKKLS